MAFFYIYETKPLTLRITPADALNDYKQIIVSFAQGKTLLEKTDTDLTVVGNDIKVWLSQEETAQFRIGLARVQVNILYIDSERDTSVEGTIEVRGNLHKKVMA